MLACVQVVVRDASVLPEGECGEGRGEYLGRKNGAAAIAAQLCYFSLSNIYSY